MSTRITSTDRARSDSNNVKRAVSPTPPGVTCYKGYPGCGSWGTQRVIVTSRHVTLYHRNRS